jgi:hypothetical protein
MYGEDSSMEDILPPSSTESSPCPSEQSVSPTEDPAPSLSLAEKTLEVCRLLKTLYMTPDFLLQTGYYVFVLNPTETRERVQDLMISDQK